jgi:hypothetical protein
MTTDNGGAPCVFNNLLSLAICKPRIRKRADIGALVFGFGGQAYQERLLYIARITDKKVGPVYYQLPEFSSRPDCIYQVVGGRAELKASAKYHFDSDQRKRDVGTNFDCASVLLSKDFRYLGREGTDAYKLRYPHLRVLIEGLRQGHRRNHPSGLRAELLELKEEVWEKNRKMNVGMPSDNDCTRRCNYESPCIIC